MGFATLLGQPTARATLERAAEAHKIHHAYRFQGPEGVGKEHAALLLCQTLLCPHRSPFACGECSSCRRVFSFSPEPPQVSVHPDLLFVQRGLYPSQLLGGSSEATGISVEQIRRIVLPRIGFPPHEGQALCVVIRRAEELTQAAANALLKTLEEPPSGTHFILMTSRPGKLLDTIVSRTLAVRFAPLPSDVLQRLMSDEGLDTSPQALELAEGSLARARDLASPELLEARQSFVAAADAALLASHPAAATSFADARAQDRDDLRGQLAHLAHTYARRGRLEEDMRLWARRHEEVLRAITEVERNGSPALVLEALMGRLRRAS